ncbi:hypothetical protein Agabi119p4_7012 [Agaricus bisporus var. burnettii]|uniref:Uncharacterized protein n=1 Tax=Agaricus bisporus var. burnettii TaxID=192524 RepID=A0A8H7F0L5_AGABI|nr:hypothetical protein Agabi119p4_7012 [Agaricus bisporus var. burnettii]
MFSLPDEADAILTPGRALVLYFECHNTEVGCLLEILYEQNGFLALPEAALLVIRSLDVIWKTASLWECKFLWCSAVKVVQKRTGKTSCHDCPINSAFPQRLALMNMLATLDFL